MQESKSKKNCRRSRPKRDIINNTYTGARTNSKNPSIAKKKESKHTKKQKKP